MTISYEYIKSYGFFFFCSLLLDDDCRTLKIADFGAMVYMSTDAEYRQGSAPWMAPEVYCEFIPRSTLSYWNISNPRIAFSGNITYS